MRLFALIALACCVFLAGCLSSGVRIDSVASVYSDRHNARLNGYVRMPDGEGPFPAVILMHGCYGLSDVSRRGLDAHADALVASGFVTLVLDSFSSRGKYGGIVCQKPSETLAAYDYRVIDAFHVLRYLRSQSFIDGNNIFLMGQSHGGGVALRVAADLRYSADGARTREVFPGVPLAELRFTAVVAYYPYCGQHTLKNKIVSPVLVLSGSSDTWGPPGHCLTAMEYSFVEGAPYEVIVYEGAHHSFDLPGIDDVYLGYVNRWNGTAALDSRERMIEWFLEHKI